MDVLIVDDDLLTRQGLMKIMPWHEFKMQVVGEAGNGLEALQFLKGHHVDLVLCDLEMPVMQGLEFIEKASSLYPDIYFVVLTIYTDFVKIQQALRLGAIDYIAKTSLDRESYSKTLGRIAERINKEQEKKKVYVDRPVHPKYPNNQTLQRWCDLLWIWRDDIYSSAIEELNTFMLSEEWCRSASKQILTAWNSCYSQIFNVRLSEPNNVCEITSFMTWCDNLRKISRAHMIEFPYSQDIFLSIIHVGEHVRQHLSESISIRDAANLGNLSRSYFCQCFHDIYHMSFLDYTHQARLDKAKELLLETNLTIQSIAREIGYDDEKYFSRFFRQRCGLSPNQYRKNR